MKSRLSFKPIGSGILCVSLCLGALAYAQDASQNTTNQSTTNAPKAASTAASGQDQYPDLIEIDPFGGVSTWGQVQRGLTTKLVNGGVGGLRLAYNPSAYLGIELWGAFDQANVNFKQSSGFYPTLEGTPSTNPLPTYSFGARNYFFGLNPILNLKPRGSKFQPYLTVGVNGIQFTPTDEAKSIARTAINDALYHAANLNDNLQVGLNYGGGVKWHFTDHFGMRVDARGFWSRNPTYGLPNYPNGGVYIPAHDKINGFMGTVGLVWYAGTTKCPEMPPAPPPPAPLPTPTISGVEGTICPGKPVTLHATLSGAPADHKLKYAWTVNGEAQGSDSPDLTLTPNNTGTFNIQVTVTDTTPPPPPLERPKKFPVRCWVQPPAPQPVAPVTGTASVTVSAAAPTISSVTADTPTLDCAAVANGKHTTGLTVAATASACGGNLTYKWTVSEGSVTNDSSQNATFDASSLNFEGGAQGQSKTVTATVTVTDERGQTASQSTTITVNCPPQFVRLDDVIFAKNNARVNNCGKRVLIDDAASRMASGDYDLVLVGHRDTDERENAAPARGRRGRNATPTALDEQRVLNAAAVLSGGTGTCGKVDPSRIKVDWVATDQTSETKPGLCGTSNIKERRGSQTTEADKNRRVEVYLVPHNSTSMPPAVKNPKPLPEDQVKALGCPK
ncbi:MAG TPA: PKD domain-containing protein [Bryobacteraceae bacterium]|jgi:outer membrane protein OmpA-like peptidoglycan-associated protein/outer membrane protein W